MKKHAKVVATKPSYYAAEPGDSYQVLWLCGILNARNLNFQEVANLLHTTKQTISNWMHNESKMSFASIYTLCKKLELKIDPEEVYTKIKG